MRFFRLTWLQMPAGMAWALLAALLPAAETPTSSPDPLAARRAAAQQAITDLDANAFSVRRKAAAMLESLVDDSELAPYLAEQFERVLLSGDTSFEVRSHLEPLLPRVALPLAAVGAVPAIDQIDPLVQRLSSDSFAARVDAQHRLQAMLQRRDAIGPLFIALKQRSADAKLATEDRRALEPLLDRAREAWLMAGPDQVPLPVPSDEQMQEWMATLTAPAESPVDDLPATDRFRRNQAERELLDLVARDDTRDRVLVLLEQQIAAHPQTDGGALLRSIADFARPGMAAEVWMNRSHVTVQYLLVNMPQFNEGAQKSTHFDRIDEVTAHCVSGVSLLPGEYPVRVAIPHPTPGYETMYFLTNLPTPRRRLLFEYQLKRDEAERLREITRRTIEQAIAAKQPWSETRILLLNQLDPRTVSRLIPGYFAAVNNQKLLAPLPELGSQPTLHEAICFMLSRMGTHEVVPTLLQMARSAPRETPSGENPVRIAAIAALAIAQRDPMLDVDRWLLSLIDDETPMVDAVDQPPLLGPCAAAMLLDRHGVSPRAFGLQITPETGIGQFRFTGYRYGGPNDAEEVRRWWRREGQAASLERQRQAERP